MSDYRIFLADLAHCQTVPDTALPVPLSIGYVAAYARRHFGRTIDIRLFKHPERLLAAVVDAPPDVIGFANYGWNTNLTREVGRYLRRRMPDALFVAGGPNLDPDPTQRLAYLDAHDYLDFLIVDGGEEPFVELVEWWRDTDRDRDRLPRNTLWRGHDGTLHAATERPLKKVIEGIVSPYLEGELDEFLALGMVPMLETNRGCPFRCTFCAWGMASKDLVRRFDLKTALAEIAYIGERSRARNWIVCDANFGILPRDVEIARAIRKVKDETGAPDKCHVWLAKNATERNLEIATILGDMVVPVMAVQSLNEDVLQNIKRDNIKLDTYREYQKRFHRIGQRTYSDLIVPLPAETLASHLDALRELFDLDVDIVMSHNMRLLAGAETNSAATRRDFSFRTRYRLIHGDAGEYRAPDGAILRAFEYEESLRSTSTLSEQELFYLRKLHFLVDFCWNIEVYKTLLRVLRTRGINPLEIIVRLLSPALLARHPRLGEFWAAFDEESEAEWFDSVEDIQRHFSEEGNWRRLVGLEYEKLNIKFGVTVLKSYKDDFDVAIHELVAELSVDRSGLDAVCRYTFALFPSLDAHEVEREIQMPEGYKRMLDIEQPNCTGNSLEVPVRLVPAAGRSSILPYITGADARAFTLSKILNTAGISLRELRYHEAA